MLNPIPMKKEKASAVNCGLLALTISFRQSIRSEETSENVNGLLSGGASRGNDFRTL